MKFTKQEQSLIKLAAAHMAPQMLKKATLQDKLAEYGIGLNKKAADIPEFLKEAPKPGLAQAANPLLSFSKPKPGFEWIADQTQTSAPAVKPSGAQVAPFMPTDARLASGFAPARRGRIAKAVPTTAPAPAPAAPAATRGMTPQMSALQRIMQYLAKGRQNGRAAQ